MFEKILLAYDLSQPSRHALEWALQFSSHLGSQIHLISILPDIKKNKLQDSLNQAELLQKNIENLLDHHLMEIAGPDFATQFTRPKLSIYFGDTSKSILRIAVDENPDLIILGTHSRKGLKALFLGSVAEKCASHSPFPLFIAKTSPHWPPQNILFPSDLSENSRVCFSQAIQWNEQLKSKLHLLNIIPIKHIEENIPGLLPAWAQEDYEELKLEALKEIKTFAQDRTGIEYEVTQGSVIEAIEEYATQKQCDIILTPSHGRSGLEHVLLGSVAGQIIRLSNKNTLVYCPQTMSDLKKNLIAKQNYQTMKII